ncbi:MAG: energy transducer TonB [Candidatus Acidiferrales bacterium]
MCEIIFRPARRRIVHALAALTVLALPFALCAHAQSSKDAAARAQATALFAKALAASDIRAPGSPPFEMRATIIVAQRFGKPATGAYSLKWASPEKWREEIHFANYTRIRIGEGNRYWQSRTTSYELEQLLQLSQGLDFLKDLHVWSKPEAIADMKAVKLHQEKPRGTKLDCVTLIRKEQEYGSDFCFDPVRGVLVRDGPGSSTVFSGFISFAGKLFPGNIGTDDESAARVTFAVNSILPLANTGPDDFQPADGSSPWPYCDDPDAVPKSTMQPGPVYPISEKLSHTQGTVFAYAVIGADGRLHSLQVLTSPDSGLANSALTAFEQWQYIPEMCHGTPVPVETLLKAIFTLGAY